MACKIIKDKISGEEYLIPYCYSVINKMHLEISDRKIIKDYCRCRQNKKVEKYEVHTRDEVIVMIEKLEAKILNNKNELAELENQLDCIKSEVFMLNTVEVF